MIVERSHKEICSGIRPKEHQKDPEAPTHSSRCVLLQYELENAVGFGLCVSLSIGGKSGAEDIGCTRTAHKMRPFSCFPLYGSFGHGGQAWMQRLSAKPSWETVGENFDLGWLWGTFQFGVWLVTNVSQIDACGFWGSSKSVLTNLGLSRCSQDYSSHQPYWPGCLGRMGTVAWDPGWWPFLSVF